MPNYKPAFSNAIDIGGVRHEFPLNVRILTLTEFNIGTKSLNSYFGINYRVPSGKIFVAYGLRLYNNLAAAANFKLYIADTADATTTQVVQIQTAPIIGASEYPLSLIQFVELKWITGFSASTINTVQVIGIEIDA